jgi:hypothetical protein
VKKTAVDFKITAHKYEISKKRKSTLSALFSGRVHPCGSNIVLAITYIPQSGLKMKLSIRCCKKSA